jgi:hypothetical protein
LLQQFVLILLERGISGDERVHGVVVDRFGVQLLIDPLVETDGPHPSNVARSGAEGQPIQRLDDLLIGGQLANIRARYNGFGRCFRTGFLRVGTDRCSTNQ